jgi:hypothetical protein
MQRSRVIFARARILLFGYLGLGWDWDRDIQPIHMVGVQCVCNYSSPLVCNYNVVFVNFFPSTSNDFRFTQYLPQCLVAIFSVVVYFFARRRLNEGLSDRAIQYFSFIEPFHREETNGSARVFSLCSQVCKTHLWQERLLYARMPPWCSCTYSCCCSWSLRISLPNRMMPTETYR